MRCKKWHGRPARVQKTGDNGRGRPFYVGSRQTLEKRCLRPPADVPKGRDEFGCGSAAVVPSVLSQKYVHLPGKPREHARLARNGVTPKSPSDKGQSGGFDPLGRIFMSNGGLSLPCG
jgi:hypothetical protein